MGVCYLNYVPNMELLTMTLVLCPFSRTTGIRQHQNVSILDFIGAKDYVGGGDNWSYIRRAKFSQIVTTNKLPPNFSQA